MIDSLKYAGMAGLVATILGSAAFAQSDVSQAAVGAIQMPALAMSGFMQAISEETADHPALSQFYAARDYRPLWTSGEDAPRRAAFFRALGQAQAQGLPAESYHARALQQAFFDLKSERQRGQLEVRMSEAFLRYAQDASRGVLTPSKVDPTIVRVVERPDNLTLLREFSQSDSPLAWLHGLAPQDPAYAKLLKAKLDLEHEIETGGWGPQVPSSVLRPGDTGHAVLALRDRLQRMGYLSRTATARYDAQIQKAVQQYQADQGLSADGIAGASTLEALNVAPEERLKSLLVALERLRWMNGMDLGKRRIWVNIADFSVKVIDDDKVTFQSVTVVGQNRPDRQTPEFSDSMDRMVINPAWHVPRSIVTKEYLPMMQRNPNAAAQIQVVDSRGQVIPRNAINFAQYTTKTFPFAMRQAPSRSNALGLVKFLFPNKYNIYLHDTPSKSLFSKEQRAFSHGCVRVGQPFELAYTLLAPQVTDPKSYFQRILDSGRETTVKITPPVPVHLVYFTAWPNAKGGIEYRKDVYGRDARIYAALHKAGVESAALTN
ncbi:L,D-transpeptidase family protein [Thioclava litoralis]|uniref:L,D-transpeptidase family protein n=1 Tax=Thioclava litoralis TaxID=3076557 RepID=A0ABZ1DXN4_9RHOB|nr:L,D-transpeptidase family protein [Thioclava sp. FTW29]